jgi:hypothetical protein
MSAKKHCPNGPGYGTSPKISLNLAFSATSAGDPPGRRSVEQIPGQTVLRARLSRLHDEFVQPPRVVANVFATAKAIDRKPHGFVQGPCFQFDGMLNAFRILERHATRLHGKKNNIFAFCSPCVSPQNPRTAFLQILSR